MLADTEEVALSFEQSNLESGNLLRTDRIRILAIFLFLFATFISSSFITMFVVIIVFLSMDFWTVKNITGRLLVGLRWWNHVDEDGKNYWIFENRKNNQSSNNLNNAIVESTTEANLFWSGIIIADLIWLAFFFVSLLSLNFKWITIIVVALMLNMSNTYGFLKCRFGAEQNLKNVATSFFGQQVIKSMFQRAANPTDQHSAQSGVNQAQNSK